MPNTAAAVIAVFHTPDGIAHGRTSSAAKAIAHQTGRLSRMVFSRRIVLGL